MWKSLLTEVRSEILAVDKLLTPALDVASKPPGINEWE